jgi:UDP-glucuronate 4-epimerase
MQNSNSIAPGTNEIFNIGGGNPVSINELISAIDLQTGLKLVKNITNSHTGDVGLTIADPAKLQSVTSFKPSISLAEGLEKFFLWANQDEIKGKLAPWAQSVP